MSKYRITARIVENVATLYYVEIEQRTLLSGGGYYQYWVAYGHISARTLAECEARLRRHIALIPRHEVVKELEL